MNYTQQNFKNGDVLNADELNKIENAILELVSNTNTLEGKANKAVINVKLTKDGISYQNPESTSWTKGEGTFSSFLTANSFKATQIETNKKLDSLTEFGNYIGSGEGVGTITNRPETGSSVFYLQVVKMLVDDSDPYIVQIYTVAPLGDVYYRYKNGSAGAWKKWVEITNVYHPIEEVETRDLNKFVNEKKWRCSDSAIIGNLQNKPIDITYPFELEVSRTKEGLVNQKYYIPSKGVIYNRSSIQGSSWSHWEKTSLNGDILSYNANSSTISNNSWRITRVGDLIIHNGSFYSKKDLDITLEKIIPSPETNPKVYSTPQKVIPLQMPIVGSRAVVFGSVGEGKGYIGSTLIKNNVNLCFQAHSPLNDLAYKDSSTFNNIYKIGAIGQRADPPSYSNLSLPVTDSSIKAQIKEIIKTYFDAREGGAKFKWGRNWFSNYYSYGTNGGPVIDNNGYRVLQCDAFVGLILMGQKYEDVYSNMGNGSTRNFATFFSNNLTDPALKWAFCNKKDETVEGKHSPIYENMVGCTSYNNFKMCYTGLQAWFFWNQQRVFFTNNFNNLATGDIVFIRKTSDSTKGFFDNITHMGILTADNGTIYINQVGTAMNDKGELGGDCALSKVPLRTYLNLTIHSPDTEFYFARPPYNERQARDNKV